MNPGWYNDEYCDREKDLLGWCDTVQHSETHNSCVELGGIIYSFIYLFYWMYMHCSDTALNCNP